MAEEPQEITPEQLLEHIRRMKVSDLLVSTIATVGQLGYAKLDPEARDLEQARLAIEALKALIPLLEGVVPPESIRDFNQLVANLQLAYASAVSESGASEGQAPGQGLEGQHTAGAASGTAASGGQAPGPSPEGQDAASSRGAEDAPREAAPPDTDTSRGQAPGQGSEGQ